MNLRFWKMNKEEIIQVLESVLLSLDGVTHYDMISVYGICKSCSNLGIKLKEYLGSKNIK